MKHYKTFSHCIFFITFLLFILGCEFISKFQNGNKENDTAHQNIGPNRHNVITKVVQNTQNAIVNIATTHSKEYSSKMEENMFFPKHFPGIQKKFEKIGSGVIISEDGQVVTNKYVLDNSADVIIITLINNQSYKAKLIAKDNISGVVLLQIITENNQPFPYIPFGNSDNIAIGEWVIAMGNPYGLFIDESITVSAGIISSLNRNFRPNLQESNIYIDLIQTDATINMDNIGGPLLNSNGEIIGLNTIKNIQNQGETLCFSYAMPSNQVKNIVEQLAINGKFKLNYDIGFTVTQITDSLIMRYQLPEIDGIIITKINKDSPSYKQGLRPGDIILYLGKERIINQSHMEVLLRKYKRGNNLPIKFQRGDKYYEITIPLKHKTIASR